MPMGEDPRHGLLVALVVALVGLLLLIFAALTVAPALVIVLGLMTYVVWWYVSREDTSFMHHAQEHENRFWTTVAFCFSGALVFVHDSPVALGQWSPVLGFLFVMMFTFSVHSYDRQLHRSRIGRAPNFRPSVESSAMLHSNVQDKCRRISVCLSKLDNRLVATNLNHMLWADMVQNLEKEIVNILSDADPSELNYMLPKIGLGLLFYKVKDHFPTNLHRTRLLDLLAVTRISELNVTSRALVLDALQQMKLSAHRKSELYARNVIVKTKGDELSELKNLTDIKGDIHSIHKLVYQDIKDPAIREEVLKHIATQAKVQAAHMRLGTRTGSRRSGKAWRKILSDVDDTLTSSGGRFPAGVDKRYPRKSVYPGVLDFYRELDLGVNGPSEWPNGQLGNLVFLSARPHVYKDMSESQSYAKFKKLQEQKGLYTSPTLLAGDIDTGRTMLLTGNMEPVAEKKFQNFAEYVSLYPEFKHVFVGDNGQGDVMAAEMMAERYPGLLEAVYMHRVVPEEKTFGYKGAETRKGWKDANIVFFGDYVEAACHAYKRGLIQAVGLQRVCQGAVQQFVDMKFEGPLERELQRRQINQSVWKANKLLQAVDLEPNWLIRAERAFDDMEAVLTPFGRGTVVNFRPEDGVYEVLLDWSKNTSAMSRNSVSTKPPTAPVTPSHGRLHASSMHSPIGPTRATLPGRPTSSPSLRTGAAAASSSSPPHSDLPPAALSTPASGTGSPAIGGAETRSGVRVTTNTPPLARTPPVVVMPQRGPDAAGGGEVVRDSRMRGSTGNDNPGRIVPAAPRSTATTAATAAVVTSGRSAAASAASVASSNETAAAFAATAPTNANGAEEAAGAPAAVFRRERRDGQAAAASVPAVPAAADTVPVVVAAVAGEAVPEMEAKSGSSEQYRVPAVAAAKTNVASTHRSGNDQVGPWTEGQLPSPPFVPFTVNLRQKPPEAMEETVAATALAASAPGCMAVRAYLQLPSLKKAPPEVAKKINYKDEVEEPKSSRLTNRLSIFRSGQDAGSANTKSPARVPVVITGTVVQTFMGPATVRSVRSEDGMCEVTFQRWMLGNGKQAFGVLQLADVVADSATTASAVGKSPSLLGRTGKAISSLFKLSADPTSTPATPAPAEPRVGDIVDTIFGPAAITEVRQPPAPASSSSSPARSGSPGKAVSRASPKHSEKWVQEDARDGKAAAGAGESVPRFGVAETAYFSAPGGEGESPVTMPPTRSRPAADGPTPTPPRAPLSTPASNVESSSSEPPQPQAVLSSSSPMRRRSNSATAAGGVHGGAGLLSFSSVDDDNDADELGAQLSSRGAGVLLPGKLFTPSPAAGPRSYGRRRRSPPPPSPAAASGSPVEPGLSPLFDAEQADNDDTGDDDDDFDASSPLGVKILDTRGTSGGRRTGGASPTLTVMYEVAFMKWRLSNNTPARAVLNRSSIWAEWERRPTKAGRGGKERRRSLGASYRVKQQQSRPSSFFGFMSMVGGLGGGSGTTKMVTPSGSPQKSRAAKSPAKPVAVALHNCDFPRGACVRTANLGPALVVKFRAEDGIYQVSLLDWGLSGGGLALAYLNRTAILSSIAVPGGAVRTTMGLGRVELVREDGVVVVVSGGGDGSVTSSKTRNRARGGATMFLQLSAILAPAKAIVGERVETLVGSGVVRAYSIASNTYIVDLGWGLVHSPQGNAIREKRTTVTSHPMSARSPGGIIKLFRWPLFGGSVSARPSPVV